MHLQSVAVAGVILLSGALLRADDRPAADSVSIDELPAVAYVDPIQSLTESFGHVLEEPLVDVPLRDVVPVVEEVSGIPCRIAAADLEDVELSPDTIVSLPEGMPLYMALDRMCLETPELEWVIDLGRGEIVVTSELESLDATVDFTYDVSDLSIGSYPHDQVPNWEFEDYWVEVVVEAHTGLEWVNIDGFGGDIERTDNHLVVNHHFRAQREIDALLSALRMRAMVVRVNQPPETTHLDEVFEQVVHVDFDGIELETALASLAEQTGIAIQIDPRILNRHPYLSSSTISWSSNDQPLRDVLPGILDSAQIPRFKLGYYVRAGAIWIAFDYGYGDTQETMVYNVENLLSSTHVSTLIRRIQEEAIGKWIDRDGIGGEVSPTPYGYLIITQTRRVHFEIADLLAEMRTGASACGN